MTPSFYLPYPYSPLPFINPHPPCGFSAKAPGGEFVSFGDEVLQATDVGALGAELYLGLAVLYLVYGLVGLVKGQIQGGSGFIFPNRGGGGLEGTQELPDLGRGVASQHVDGQVGRFGILDFLWPAAVVALGGDEQVGLVKVIDDIHR